MDGHITGETYLRLLKIIVKPEMDASRQLNRVLVFQQDNAKAHKTDAVMDYLEKLGVWGDWLASSESRFIPNRKHLECNEDENEGASTYLGEGA